MLLLLSPQIIWAEGSKEINSNGGGRAFLFSSTIPTSSFPFPTLGTMKVYVKAGETLNLGSSAQGVGSGTINLRAPDGTTYTSGSSKTVGVISNDVQESAGPLPATNGYTPYVVTATAAQEGIWEVDFIAPGTDNGTESNPVVVPAGSNWQQPLGPYVAAFDITVVNAANAVVKGRVFTNIFCGVTSSFSIGFNGVFHILTKDGYQYTLDNNGQAGNGFSFFANNKGFKTAGGAASYQSINNTAAPLVQNPTAPDTQSDITHKIFFNTPAADLPQSAKTPDGSTTWLINPPFQPKIEGVAFVGAEGTDGKAGTAPLGGAFTFYVTANGSYTLTIDANNNGSYADAVDRKLKGTATTGFNSVAWDGLDGLGNKISAGPTIYNADLAISLFNAEVHFPFFDVERNINGIKLTRTTGAGAPDYTVYWDDSPITLSGTPSSPLTNLTGISSLINGHKWGSATFTNSELDFGNNKSIDTWAYVTQPTVDSIVTFTVSEADLEVVSLTSDVITGCVGQTINYTAVVKNNGPNDVTGSTFAISFPTELTDVKVTSTAITGTTAITTDSTGKTNYMAKMDMANASVRTFNITGKVSKAPSGKLVVSASILRPKDITDPDATNPDPVAPLDPVSECNSSPSGIGCNNIKTDSVTFVPSPDAGPDQTVERDKVATVTANQTGTWTQIGVTPTVAHISSPSSDRTEITSLAALGPYKFVFTNINGCTDTVTVNVTSSKLDAPNVVTPNGDGNNDQLVIPDINLFPGSRLAIYNRWGNEVYHSDNYANDWAGKGLADGTYYYVLNRKEANGGIKVFKGWIYLKH
ncbi:gliding motility-associated C-terminal domain-containing protein [Mucilaginibacter panaciglaebae]|uniref:DUF11 domain-containing protein n=1 Tax=Mucilaginibacter panaciglaebae TaxID=502331 RepID=A0ABP7WIS5_9SPHI